MRAVNAALCLAMFLLVSHSHGSVQAYLDPNTGSMALQLLLAGVVGVLATIRLYWSRVKAFVASRQPKREGVSERH
jgi:hypothetical protein